MAKTKGHNKYYWIEDGIIYLTSILGAPRQLRRRKSPRTHIIRGYRKAFE
jgi:hypothetical protein